MNLGTKKNYNISFVIIIVNIIIFIASYILYSKKILSLYSYMVLDPTNFIKFKFYWTPFTYMFAHSGVSHLFFNMFAMFIFGHSIEERMGSVGFTVYYLITGALAGIFSILIYTVFNMNVYLLGASGAIYAVLFSYAVFYPNRKIYIWGILPISPPILILIYTALDLYSQLFRATNVAHITHLSGFLFAFLYFKIVYKINPLFIFRNYKNFTE